MAARRPTGRAPNWQLEIDPTDTLSVGLTSAFLLNNQVDLVRGKLGTVAANAVFTASARGPVLNCPSASGSISFADNPDFALTGDMSITAWINPADRASYRAICGKTSTGTFPVPFDFYLTTTTGLPTLTRGSGSANWKQFVGTAAPATGVWTHIAVTGPAANTSAAHYLNGVPNGTPASSGGAGTAVVATGTDNFIIGTRNGGGTQWSGSMQLVKLWNRQLSPAEVAQDFFDPWGVFRAVKRRSLTLRGGRRPMLTMVA